MDPTLEQIVAATKASLKANATLIDEAKCHVYGQFLHRMNQAEANGLYWSCFIFNIMLLIIVACLYTSSIKRQKYVYHSHVSINKQCTNLQTKRAFEIAFHVSTWHPEISERDIEGLRRSHRRSEHWLLFASFVAASVMIPVIIIEALAGLNINFCHKQDLIMFYWGPFFLLSVGTLIATWGLFLSQSIENEPAWNVALGTPVLVFAALGHWAHVFVRYSWRQMRDKEKKVVHPSLAPRDLCPR
ncbi:uncharacterized protein LY89DRAFT_445796 [Mollisia scopiformis]|uniref:Uncharacterized protein n=1 Tax=Mollisia scopiformis TaxID=149040 RepID=A0A194XK53_MOLSC|nr:uncharacterized protein LY89DRAFT_445796 [Mollisia scopiformis]KUJ20521.1 hypothetical protein LY89DRAFT_445796 [Mollisia scopiformis]